MQSEDRKALIAHLQSPLQAQLSSERHKPGCVDTSRYTIHGLRECRAFFKHEVALQPHRVRYWLNANPTDPVAFRAQVKVVCDLYQQAPALLSEGIHVISSDEITGIQALERAYPIAPREISPLAKTVRTCRRLLNLEPAMWLSVTVDDVELTNNDLERGIQTAVIGRRLSFGSQTQAGSLFVSRILTVVASLRAQQRNVLEYMTQSVQAARDGKSAPSLLPQSTSVISKSVITV